MELGHCQVCGQKLGSRIHSFYSRTQKVVVERETKTISVLYELQEKAFCGHECWQAIESAIVEGLHPLYQPLQMFATCSECRKPVDRTERHYTLNIGELEDISRPCLASMRILDEREIVVFCPACRAPAEDLAAAVMLDADSGTDSRASASEEAQTCESLS
jgi:hypothetical protein